MSCPPLTDKPQFTPVTCMDDVDCLITESDFFIENLDPTKAPYFSPGDRLNIEMNSSLGGPTLKIVSYDSSVKPLEFKTINYTDDFCNLLTPLSQFIYFDVELTEYEDAKWRFELLRQRFPPRLPCKPNNKDTTAHFFFYSLDSRFDPEREDESHLQSGARDGQGGGIGRQK